MSTSPTMQRSELVRGAGSLLYGNTKLFSKEEINAGIDIETWRPNVATHGEDAPRISNATGEIKFTPVGRLTQAILDLLYPSKFQTPLPGMRLFPNADVVLTIHGMDGKKVTFKSACPSAMPDLTLSPKKTAIGESTFKAVIANGAAREDAGSFYEETEEAWAETFDPTTIITCPYRAKWGMTELFSKEGFNIKFEVSLEEIIVDGIGTIDYQVKSVAATCSFAPVNMTVAQLMAAMKPEGIALGSSLRQGKNLRICATVAGGLAVTLFDAAVDNGGAQWKTDDSRIGEITFRASRELVGAPASLGKLFEILLVVHVSTASIAGNAQVGQTLTASANAGATGLSYQWKECDTVDGVYADINGATASTYLLAAGQTGKYVKVLITGDNGSSATSDATAGVLAN